MLKNYSCCAFAILFIISGCAFAATGTREDPVPIGTTVDLGNGWLITVLSVTPNATDQILAENMFNEPPDKGNQFLMARVRAAYTGDDSDTFRGGYGLRVVGPSSVSYDFSENGAGVIPDSLPNSEVFTGGAIEGNIAWQVKSSDAALLVMYDSDLSKNERKYLALYGDPISPRSANILLMNSTPETSISTLKNQTQPKPINTSSAISTPETTISTVKIKSSPSSAYTSSDSSSNCEKVYVKGYYRKDGTYVNPYYRSKPGCD